MDWHEIDCPAPPPGCAAPMQQHPLYGAACAAMGARPRAFGLRLGGDLAASALILVRRWPVLGGVALLSRGPAWAEGVPAPVRAEATRALIGQLRDGRLARLRGVIATPECDGLADPLAGSRLLTMRTPGHVARLDLSLPQAARRARLHGKWRNRLVRAEAAGLAIRHAPLPADPDHWLLRKEAEQARARGYRSLPASFTHAWAALGRGDGTRLFTAHAGGETVAAMLFLRHGAAASYHVGWAGCEGRRLNAHTLLLWQAADWLARKGHAWLELGTLDTIGAPGLSRFKLGAGAEAVALGATRLDAPGTRLAAALQALPDASCRDRASRRAARRALGQASSSASQ